jgi:hypothetical protein
MYNKCKAKQKKAVLTLFQKYVCLMTYQHGDLRAVLRMQLKCWGVSGNKT